VSAKSTPEPYVGPRPFDREDYARFFGRFREADDLLSLVLAHPVVLIYAASGAGKTSLLNAGLIPRLAEEEFQILGPARVTGPVPPGTGEITNIYRFHALAEWNSDLSPSIATASELASLSLADFLHRLDVREPGRPRFLLFDQFEEFFAVNVAQSEQRRAFIEELAQSLSAAPRLKVVFAMREDYVTQFEPFAYMLPDKLRTRMRLEPLRARAAVEAIREPLKAFDLSFEEGTNDPAEALVRELLKISVITETGRVREITGEFVDPLQLQVVCQNMWHNFPLEVKAYAQERQTLSQEAKRPAKKIRADQVRIEDVDLALAHHYERAITEAVQVSDASEGQLRRWFDSSLITAAGYRGIALRASEETAALPETALAVFLDKRLVRMEVRGASTWYELTHDRFIEPIQRSNRVWLKERAESEALLRMLEAKAKAGTAGAFLDESETREAEAFLASPDARVLGPSPQVESLVRQSRRHVDKEARQRRVQLTLAWSTIAVLLVAFLWSYREWNKAQAALQEAIIQKEIAQKETLRTEVQNYEHMSTIQQMADRLVELSTSKEALFWHGVKAEALSEIGRHEDSIKEYDLVLRLDPQNLNARSGRGYEYYIQREPEKARQDTEAYLAKVSISWRAHRNLGISLGLQGRYAEADKAIRDSIREFQVAGSEARETQIAPNIQAAIGHTILTAPEKAALTANYYELANLKAYAGSEEFDALLKKANKQPHSADAALFALNWACMQMEGRKEDYGALVAQGALWERAGFKGWAKKCYQDFERTHKETKNKRYDGLAHWAARRLAKLKRVGPALVEKVRQVETLELQAQQFMAADDLGQALERINSAIDIAGPDARLYLYRALIFFVQGHYSKCKADCDRILSKAPKMAFAHFMRGVVTLESDRKIAEADLQKAVEYDPGEGYYNAMFANVLYDRSKKEGFETSRPELDKALQLLERSTGAENVEFKRLPEIYYGIARIHRARRDFPEAIKSLETAISIKDDNSDFYTLWRKTQKDLGKNEAQASCLLAGFHRQIAETKLRLDNSGKALDACWRGLEALTADEKQVNEADVKQEMAAIMSEISQIIERAGSKAKATEFWQSIAKLESMKLLRDGAKAELQILSKPQ
jgi:tetratricopeptide (TPR) repeat protein